MKQKTKFIKKILTITFFLAFSLSLHAQVNLPDSTLTLEYLVMEYHNDLQKAYAEIDRLHEKIRNNPNVNQELLNIIDSLKQHISEQNASILSLNNSIIELNKIIIDMGVDIKTRDELIVKLQGTIKTLEETIELQKELIKDQFEQINNLNIEISDLNLEIQLLKSKIKQLNGVILDYEYKLALYSAQKLILIFSPEISYSDINTGINISFETNFYGTSRYYKCAQQKFKDENIKYNLKIVQITEIKTKRGKDILPSTINSTASNSNGISNTYEMLLPSSTNVIFYAKNRTRFYLENDKVHYKILMKIFLLSSDNRALEEIDCRIIDYRNRIIDIRRCGL